MARLSLTEKMAKETNNFTDPDYIKAYNEECEAIEQEIRQNQKATPQPKAKAYGQPPQHHR